MPPAQDSLPLGCAAIALVATGVAGADDHLIGDRVAGTFLGQAGAAGTLALGR
jgi:hypothetical protein